MSMTLSFLKSLLMSHADLSMDFWVYSQLRKVIISILELHLATHSHSISISSIMRTNERAALKGGGRVRICREVDLGMLLMVLLGCE